MDEGNKYIVRFYKYIDRPMLLFIVEIDDVMIGFGVFATLMISCMLMNVVVGGYIFVFLFLSLASSYLWRLYKDSKPNGYTVQMLYKIGLLHPTDFPKQKSMRKKSKFKIAPLSISKTFYGQ